MPVPEQKRNIAQASKLVGEKTNDYGRQIPEGSPQADDTEAEQNRQRKPEEAAGHSCEASSQQEVKSRPAPP